MSCFVVYIGAGPDVAPIPETYRTQAAACRAAAAALALPGVTWADVARIDRLSSTTTRETTVAQLARLSA